MLKGVYKTTPCNYEHKSGKCNKGSKCCFAHSTDDGREIDAEVMPFRFKVYTKLYNDVFPLTFEIRHEIGKMSDEELDEAMLKKDLYQERVEERSQRPRVHDNSRSPRSSPSDRDSRTPDPQRSKGKGKGDAQALMDIDEDTSARQRDLTSGGADEDEVSDREEAVALIDNNIKGGDTSGTRAYANVASQRWRRHRAYPAIGERRWGYRHD